MNESFMSSFASLYESLVTLTSSSGELGLFVLYIYYLLVLLRDKGSSEIVLQIGVLLREVEESMMDAALKQRITAELQELVSLLQRGKVQHYRERVERFLAVLRDSLSRSDFRSPPTTSA